MIRSGVILVVAGVSALAQAPKDVRAVAKQGPQSIPTVAQYLNSASVDTRVEAVKQLIALGGRDIIDPLIRATRDNDPEVQIRATDGLVNYYLPGYVKQGMTSSLVRAGSSIRAKFSDTNDQVIPDYIIVNPDVIVALGQLARGGSSLDSRANACRAVGILRGDAALPDLLEALRTKDNRVMYEALIALQKIRNPSAGPRVAYLVRDLDDKVQSAAIETVGILRAADALPALRDIVKSPRNSKAERSALNAIALMPEPVDHSLFRGYLTSKDDKLRAAAAEGLGRLNDPSDKSLLEQTWKEEGKIAPRLASAFALVNEGDLSVGEEAPLRYLIDTLNSSAYKDVASAYLVEAARNANVRSALYAPMAQGTRDEKIGLSRVFAASGDGASIPYLEKLSRDQDSEVAQEGLRALRSLRARLKV
ncbi:MAG TPA: HEAT repeat domain-containing protein [Bryobacteraceae bacterium]|nr:HEAT repeat domain-containing protein [Bryobacteraceae bacterium]